MKVLTALLAITLGMAPTAAAIHFDGPHEVVLGESVEVEIISDTSTMFAAFVMFDAGTPVDIDGPGFPDYCIPEPGCPCGCMRFGEYCACMLTVTPGDRWICQLTSTGADLATVYRLDLLDADLATALDTHTITVVPAPPTLEVLAPNGGEELVAGATYKIEWADSRSEANCPSDYLLHYSSDNGENWIPVDSNSVSNTCSHDWLVPSVDSNECLIRITDSNDPGIHDTSDAAFSISTPLQQPRIITVDDDAPADFNNIQAAIDDANDGDTILVADGIYTGNGNRDIDFHGKAVTVKSENGPGKCIIDCGGTEADPHRAFYFHSGEGRDSAVIGFAIINGNCSKDDCLPMPPFTCHYFGGAIRCNESSPVISQCAITGCRAEEGGGIYCIQCAPKISLCTIAGNYASHEGGGIKMETSYTEISNSIVWGNDAPVSPQICHSGQSMITVAYSDVQGGWSDFGNIEADPCFADPCNADYHLKSQGGRWDGQEGEWTTDEVTSPCIDAGDPMSPIGTEPFPNGGMVNMGAFGGTSEASKSYFGEPLCETIVAGDINGDCNVNFLDFSIMALHWLEDNSPLSVPPGGCLFKVDPYALITSGGFAGQGQGIRSVTGWFELTVDLTGGTAEFSQVDATLSDEVVFYDFDTGGFVGTDDLNRLFSMTELVCTDVNETAIDFVLDRGGEHYTDINMRVTFMDDSVRLVGSMCDPCCDMYCFNLDAIAVRQ